MSITLNPSHPPPLSPSPTVKPIVNFYLLEFSSRLLSLYWGPGLGGSSLSKNVQTSPSTDTSSNFSGSIPKLSQSSQGRNSVAYHGYALGPPLSGACVEHLNSKASRGHLKQMAEPPQLTPLNAKEQRLYSELLLSDCASHLVSKGAPSAPAKGTHFSHFCV